MRSKVLISLLLLALPTSALAQKSAPVRLKLTDINGRQIRLSDYRGKVVLLNFWATWCPPCRTEIPDLIKLQHEYRSRDLRVVGVTYPPQRLAEVKRFVRKAKVNYPVGLGTRQTKLMFAASETLPMTIVIGKDGKIAEVIEGILLSEEFEQKIRPLLGRGNGERGKGNGEKRRGRGRGKEKGKGKGKREGEGGRGNSIETLCPESARKLC
ncbi:MAG TPA: TlpA disulfide reductase family protein [Pyrinomonadaceae bacterium]|nr:TlpA disulfide reductase family protein [Pyrinomonadaceae bacterium]